MVSRCSEACIKLHSSYVYFALVNGIQCQCSQNHPHDIKGQALQLQHDSHCNYNCPGDSGFQCGNPNSGSVYQTLPESTRNYCEGMGIAFIPDPEDFTCTKYIDCRKDDPIKGSCASKELKTKFNPGFNGQGYCDYPDKVSCGTSPPSAVTTNAPTTKGRTGENNSEQITDTIDNAGSKEGDNDIYLVIGAVGRASLIVTLGIVLFLYLRSRNVKCCNRAQGPEEGQELQPINETEKPIPVDDFRRSGSHWVPKEEEFDKLNRIDIKENALRKSKETGMSFVRDQIPFNRYVALTFIQFYRMAFIHSSPQAQQHPTL